MKTCVYCGRENLDESRWCHECGTELPEPTDNCQDHPATEPEILPSTQLVNLGQIEGAFSFEEGFSRPDWNLIARVIEGKVLDTEIDAAWTEAAWQWVYQLKGDLGGEYAISLSDKFILLSELPKDEACRILHALDTCEQKVRANLGPLAWANSVAKGVVLIFSDQDDYYQHLAYFYPDGVLPASTGVQLTQGYPHIALVHENELDTINILIHELSHLCVCHLPLPRWLDEGVARTLERLIGHAALPKNHEGSMAAFWGAVSGWTPPVMWDELAERHHAFWNEKNIQAFWAGVTFDAPDESSQLSYSLAEVLVHLLGQDRQAFLAFLGRAQYQDAGQAAAFECLGVSLGDTVATFLGAGKWQPLRKAIARYFGTSQDA